MATRTRYSIIKGIPRDRAKLVINQAVQAMPGPVPRHSKWSDATYVVKPKQFSALLCGDALVLADDAWPLAHQLASELNAPHLELRVQESDHWDFTLYRGKQLVADFSTRVGYFEDDPSKPRPWKQGDATSVSATWGVPLDHLAPYLIDWDSQTVPQLARPCDRFRTSDWRQGFDFMLAIGVENPYDHPDQFSLDVPMWQSAYIIQPFWRRIIRQVSVWIKGTYPDVPPLTQRQRADRERRRASVQIARVHLTESEELD